MGWLFDEQLNSTRKDAQGNMKVRGGSLGRDQGRPSSGSDNAGNQLG